MKDLTETSPTKTRGISLWTALLITLGLAVVSAGALGILLYQWKADKARTQRQFQAYEAKEMRRDLEQKQAAQDAKLAEARNLQNSVLAQARQMTNHLGQLLARTRRLHAEAIALRTNEVGRLVGQYLDLATTARRLYESELRFVPAESTIQSKLENARRIEQQMQEAFGTTYVPEPGFAAELQNDGLWCAPELRQVERCQSLLTALVQEAHAKSEAPTLTPEPATLNAALERLAQDESKFRQRIIVEAAEQAKPQAAQLLAEAERERILQDARAQVTNVMNEMRALLAQQNNEHLVREAELQKAVAAAQLQASNMMQTVAEMRQQHAQDVSVREAKAKVVEATVQVQVADQQEEARKVMLRRKAEDPKLRTLLAPFITPSYHQLNGMTMEKQPLSYTQICNQGALNPDMNGLRRLILLGASINYRDRPRWRLNGGTVNWVKHPEDIEMAKSAQSALIELGPVLVEMGLLAP